MDLPRGPSAVEDGRGCFLQSDPHWRLEIEDWCAQNGFPVFYHQRLRTEMDFVIYADSVVDARQTAYVSIRFQDQMRCTLILPGDGEDYDIEDIPEVEPDRYLETTEVGEVIQFLIRFRAMGAAEPMQPENSIAQPHPSGHVWYESMQPSSPPDVMDAQICNILHCLSARVSRLELLA